MTGELDEPRATPEDTAPDRPASDGPASDGPVLGSDAPAPGSLADQLAAWTPSWSRPEPDQPAAPADDVAVPAVPEPADDPAADDPAADDPVPESPAAIPLPDEPEDEPVAAVPPVPDGGRPDRPEDAAVPAAAAPGDGEAELPELDDPVLLRGAIEAMLMVVDEPVAEHVLAEAVQRPAEVVAGVLHELAEEYTAQRRGFALRRAAGGWRIYTRDDFAEYVQRFVLEGQQVRLTQAALETLAVVAYKQPVSRSRVSAIRGVNCDGVIRTLLTRGLIEECGSEPDSGAHLYRTSTLFLERMGIDSVAELPDLAPFLPDDLPEEA